MFGVIPVGFVALAVFNFLGGWAVSQQTGIPED
jgi:hypothetical protein